MLFNNIAYLNADFQIERGYVGVIADRITYLSSAPPANLADYGEQYAGAGRLLMPGLYNLHAHAPMTLLRGYAESLPLQDWLQQRIFPFESQMTAEDNYYGSLLAIAEMLRFGVVSYSDMYFYSDERIQAVAESGIKANICPALMVFDPDVQLADLPEAASNVRYAREFHGTLNGRLRVDLNIHSEYISNPSVVEAVGQQARELGVGTHIHLSETQLEHEECKARHHGLTPTAYFASLGFFEQPCTAAHAVWTEPADWQLLAANGVSVASCPASNFKLASGFAPLTGLLAAGVNVGLGTDGVASNNNHNMFQDLYLLATVFKAAAADPQVLSPAEALRIATLNGALAQGRPDCGRIALGNRADLVVLDTTGPWWQPISSLLNNLVFAGQGSDVVLTMVDGRVLYRDGQWPTIDVQRVAQAVQAATDRISGQLAAAPGKISE